MARSGMRDQLKRIPAFSFLPTPEYRKNQRTEALVELLDVYPTLLELCGLEASHRLEGRSFVSLLEDPESDFKSAVLTQTPRPNYPKGKMPEAMGYPIRTDRFRYTEWRDFETGSVLDKELYDHGSDPLETVNVVAGERYNGFLPELESQLEELVKR
jgi:iduronate 2-sulfatase